MDELGSDTIESSSKAMARLALVDRELDESSPRPPPTDEVMSNWAELPRDVLFLIFLKLGAFLVIVSAQWVCRPWQEASNDPLAWRVVDMVRNVGASTFRDSREGLHAVATEAIDRSNGLMEELYLAYINYHLIDYIADRSQRLKRLVLVACTLEDTGLVALAQKSPLLEHLTVHSCPSLGVEFVAEVGEACPQLKHFLLKEDFVDPFDEKDFMRLNASAFGIASCMKGLQHLRLDRCGLTNEGLLLILDHCTNLEPLYLCRCYNLEMNETTKLMCSNIRDWKLLHDSSSALPDSYDASVVPYLCHLADGADYWDFISSVFQYQPNILDDISDSDDDDDHYYY